MNIQRLILGLAVIVAVIVGLGLVRQKQMRDEYARKHPPSLPAGIMMVHFGASW